MYLSPMIPIAISYSQHGIQIGIGPNMRHVATAAAVGEVCGISYLTSLTCES